MKFYFTEKCPEMLRDAVAYQLATGERVIFTPEGGECSEGAFAILEERFPGALSTEEPKPEEPESTEPPAGDDDSDEPGQDTEPEIEAEPQPAKGKGKGKGK